MVKNFLYISKVHLRISSGSKKSSSGHIAYNLNKNKELELNIIILLHNYRKIIENLILNSKN